MSFAAFIGDPCGSACAVVGSGVTIRHVIGVGMEFEVTKVPVYTDRDILSRFYAFV
jgi:hypothetical protein